MGSYVPGTQLMSPQVLRIYPPLLPSLYRVLRMADCDLRIRGQAINGYVPILHASPANPRCTCSHIPRSPRKLRRILFSRLTSKQSPGQRLFAELVLSVKRIRLRPCHLNPLPMAQLQPQSLTLTMSPIVFCDKKTTLPRFSTRNCSTCAFPSLRLFSASSHLRRARDVCLPRR